MSVTKEQIIAKPAMLDKPGQLTLLAAWWGIAGVFAIVLYAVLRLWVYTAEAIRMELGLLAWTALIANVVFMAWSEGYRGFQQKFSPRVAARALFLTRHPVPWTYLVFAPLFCIGYFAAAKRVRYFAWFGTTAIVILVLLVHRLDQPWRGIVDAGVVVGLSWGLMSLIYASWVTFRRNEYLISPDVTGRYNQD